MGVEHFRDPHERARNYIFCMILSLLFPSLGIFLVTHRESLRIEEEG